MHPCSHTSTVTSPPIQHTPLLPPPPFQHPSIDCNSAPSQLQSYNSGNFIEVERHSHCPLPSNVRHILFFNWTKIRNIPTCFLYILSFIFFLISFLWFLPFFPSTVTLIPPSHAHSVMQSFVHLCGHHKIGLYRGKFRVHPQSNEYTRVTSQ